MLRKKTSENDPADWFAFAEERFRAADTLYRELGLTASGVEILQDAVERLLKGYLTANGWPLVKTHDLERLLRDAISYQPSFARFKALAVELTEDFFAQHYPGEDMTHVGENYEKLRADAGQMLTLIERELPQFFPK